MEQDDTVQSVFSDHALRIAAGRRPSMNPEGYEGFVDIREPAVSCDPGPVFEVYELDHAAVETSELLQRVTMEHDATRLADEVQQGRPRNL